MGSKASDNAASQEPDRPSKTCTNCGGRVEASYCTACGQKAISLDRPALSLVREVFDGFYSIDGKFWQTILSLYRVPGQATRAYLDGRRASFTPPVRLYVIAALVFVLGFQISGIALIGLVTSGPGTEPVSDVRAQTVASAGNGPINVGIRPLRPPWAAEPEPIEWETIEQVLLAQAERDEDGNLIEAIPTEEEIIEAGGIGAMALIMGRDPLAAEQNANLALNQATLAMVILFALFNALLHPRARLITHAIHSLYFHAALLPLVVAVSIASVFTSALSVWPAYLIGGSGVLAVLYLGWRSDRAVYASSWYGATLRVVFLVYAYLLSFLIVAVALILL